MTALSPTLLPDLLGEIILKQEGESTFDAVETLRQGFIKLRKAPDAQLHAELMTLIEKLDYQQIDKVIHAFSTFFHLSNISEEQQHHQSRETTEKSGQDWQNSFSHTLKQLKAEGKTFSEVMALLKELNYYPTFTAHPTEAKRPIMLNSL